MQSDVCLLGVITFSRQLSVQFSKDALRSPDAAFESAIILRAIRGLHENYAGIELRNFATRLGIYNTRHMTRYQM